MHGLRLFFDVTSTVQHVHRTDDHDIQVTKESDTHIGENEMILNTTGNWWSDINEICRRLKDYNLNDVVDTDARLAIIHEVCNDFVKGIKIGLLQALHLDGSLPLPSKLHTNNSNESALSGAVERTPGVTDTEKVLSALGAWKCFEALAGVVSVTGNGSFVRSPQHLIERRNKTPLNCVSPVEALLPFDYREGGDHKFLDLIDQQLLFLRPKVCCENVLVC